MSNFKTLISHFHQLGTIYFDTEQDKTWKYNMDQMIGSKWNVSELTLDHVKSSSYSNVLLTASMIGPRFSYNKLAHLVQMDQLSITQLNQALWSALQDQIIVQTGHQVLVDRWTCEKEITDSIPSPFHPTEFCFKILSFDTSDPSLEPLHIKMIKSIMSQKTQNIEYEILHQINSRPNLIPTMDSSTCIEACKIALRAGTRARDCCAYQHASEFASNGLLYLTTHFNISQQWTQQYHTCFELYKLKLEMAIVNDQDDDFNEYQHMLNKHVKNKTDRVKVLMIQSRQQVKLKKTFEAIDMLMVCLDLLGEPINLAMDPHDETIAGDMEFASIDSYLRGRSLESLYNEPETSDPNKLLTLKVLFTIFTLLIDNHGICKSLILITSKMTNLILQYGQCDMSGLAYAYTGLYTILKSRDLKRANEWGRLALAFAHKYDNLYYRSLVYFVYGASIGPWLMSIKDSTKYLEKCMEYAMECGELTFASYASMYIVLDRSMYENSISVVYEKHQQYFSFLKKRIPCCT